MGTQRDQLRLWLVAFLASVLINAVILISIVGMEALSWLTRARDSFQQAAVTHQAEQQAELVLQSLVQPSVTTPPPAKPREQNKISEDSAHTSANQNQAPPNPTNQVGERDTRATSDATPDPAALPMPSQKGEPTLLDQVKTTSSDFRQGNMAHDRISQAASVAQQAPPSAAGNEYEDPTVARATMPSQSQARVSEGAPRQASQERKAESLAQSPFPVDTPVKETKASKGTTQKETAPDQLEKEEVTQEQPTTEGRNEVQQSPPGANQPASQKSESAGDVYRRPTQITGSISLRGVASQDVKNSAFGRYRSSLSQVIGYEWQLNSIRNQDFSLPGILRVRFIIGSDAKVKSVEFIDSVGASAIQKGFTLRSIREAKIPPFPADLKRELKGREIEVFFTFIF